MLREYLLNLGYDNKEVMKILENYPEICLLDDDTLNKRINFLCSLGYNMDNIKRLVLYNPKILCMKDSDITNVIYTFVKLKYDYDDVINMSLKYPLIYMKSEGDIFLRYNDFVTLSYHHDEIHKITKNNPNLYGKFYDSFKDKIDYMEELGFPLKVIKKVSKDDSFNYIDLYCFKNNIKHLSINGFSTYDIIMMFCNCPRVFSINIDNVFEKTKLLFSLGYNYSYIKNIIVNNTKILLHSNEYIMMYIDLFKEYNFSLDDIKEITKNNPNLFNIDLKDLRIKLEFFRQTRLSRVVVCDSSILLYDIDIMYSRYMYLKSINKNINNKNYNLLCESKNRFSKEYQISKNDLLKTYDSNTLYSESIKRKIKRKR